MKTLNLLLLLAALLLSSGSASGAQSSSLEGTWYVGGDRGQVARITNNRGRLEARNENGDTSRLEYNGRSRVRALDWGGITGEIRGNRIDWSTIPTGRDRRVLLRATVTWKARGMLAAIATKSPASRMTGADWQQEMRAATPADSITTVGDGCARSTGAG